MKSPMKPNSNQEDPVSKPKKRTEITPESLFKLASEKYYKVYDFSPKTKKSDKTWIRVGLIPDPNKEIRWNFFNGERLLREDSFDKAEPFTDGISIVVRDHKYNALRDDGNLVFGKWLHYVTRCEDGQHYLVEKKEDDYGLVTKSAFADADGKIITVWFDHAMVMMHNGLYCVGVGDKPNERTYAVYDSEKNEIISDWYDSMMLYMWKNTLGKAFARVTKDHLYNIISEDGKPVFSVWSKKPIEVDTKTGSCQIYSADGNRAYNANVLTGELSSI